MAVVICIVLEIFRKVIKASSPAIKSMKKTRNLAFSDREKGRLRSAPSFRPPRAPGRGGEPAEGRGDFSAFIGIILPEFRQPFPAFVRKFFSIESVK
jgi:hypothetical protein